MCVSGTRYIRAVSACLTSNNVVATSHTAAAWQERRCIKVQSSQSRWVSMSFAPCSRLPDLNVIGGKSTVFRAPRLASPAYLTHVSSASQVPKPWAKSAANTNVYHRCEVLRSWRDLWNSRRKPSSLPNGQGLDNTGSEPADCAGLKHPDHALLFSMADSWVQ